MNDARGPSRDATDVEGDRRAKRVLFVSVAAFITYLVVAVPRLTNDNFGNVEFTGWSAPMASRLLQGDRPYVDFILPIPPGSFVILAGLEWLVGRPILLTELALCAALQVGMGILSYVMARALTTRRNALLTAVATFAALLQLRKECAYDHTAQLVAWGSVAAGLWAFRTEEERRRSRLFLVAGFLAGITLLFKQSTAVGCALGWGLAFSYLLMANGRRKEPENVAADSRAFGRWFQGFVLGLGGTWFVLLLLGSTCRAFIQATFQDGSALKGGLSTLVSDLFSYLFDYGSYRGSLFAIVLLVAIGARVVSRGASFRLGEESPRHSELRLWEAWTITALAVLAFVGGALVLRHGAKSWGALVPLFDALRPMPVLSLVPTIAFFAAHLVATPSAGISSSERRALRTGHVINAALLVAFACSLFHNTSAPEFRPYYDNNPIIPLTLACAFIALDRAEMRIGALVYLTLILASAGGERFGRALSTRTRVVGGPAGGLHVNEGGLAMLRMAQKVRLLTRPDETVLVLPEDLELVQLIGRPRPPLLGAVVFVDQYPERLLSDDEARLSEHLPKVIVMHPRNPESWQDFFRIWSGRSAAEMLIRHVQDQVLPTRYDRVQSYDTMFRWHAEQLDVYVRRDTPGAALP